MQAYAQEIGGATGPAPHGEHRYILMCLVALQDPGLTVFPTHRLVNRLDDERRGALAQALQRDFEIAEVAIDEAAPAPGGGPLQLGYVTSQDELAYRLRLKDQAIADAALAEKPEAYRQLDTAVLEALLLKGALGLTDDDIAHFNGLFLCARHGRGDRQGALGRVRRGVLDAPDACLAGSRRGGRGREHAAQVDLLLP